MSTAAPAIAPGSEPMPPNTTYATTRIELFRMKLSGLKYPIWLAKNTPARPEVDAPMAKAMQLHPGRVDAGGLRGDLVLADRRPRPPEPRTLQAVERDHHDGDEHEQQVPVLELVQAPRDAESEPRLITGCGTADRRSAGAVGDVARVVDRDDADDLAEPEGDDRQVVTA